MLRSIPASRMSVRTPELRNQSASACGVNVALPSHPPSSLFSPSSSGQISSCLCSLSSVVFPSLLLCQILFGCESFCPLLFLFRRAFHSILLLIHSPLSLRFVSSSSSSSSSPWSSLRSVHSFTSIPSCSSCPGWALLLSLPVDPRAPCGPVGPSRHHGRRSGLVCPH